MTETDDIFTPHDAAAAYVVDALDDTERTAFEDHLDGCDRCRDEVAELTETLSDLGAAYETEPPAELRSAVLTAISSVEQEPARPTVLPTGADRRSRTVRADRARHAHDGEVVSISSARSHRATRVLSLAVAAAMVAALALGGWAIRLNTQLNQQQQVAGAQASADAQLLAAPDAKVYPVQSANGGSVSYVVSKQLNRAQLVGVGMPSLSADQTYQAWAVGSSTRSLAVFTAGSQSRVELSGPIDTAQALAITVEPSNGGQGSAQPTTQPFATQTLS